MNARMLFPASSGTGVSIVSGAAGSFPYRCTIHPGMVGTVNVQ
jgi:plastocyanin